jgi:hypothetical protein
MLTIISLGAGVQSTTLALMAAQREINPMPHGAIFADTGAEPKMIYEHLRWLERCLPYPVYRVSAGDLRSEILGAMRGKNRLDGRPPFFTHAGGMLRRQCTHDYKLVPITRKLRELIGLKKGARGPKQPAIEQWIGISVDEAVRVKPSRFSYIQNRWPLIELGMSRSDCIAWCASRGFPRPPKSACTFCPYQSDEQWRTMKSHDPESFADAVATDEAIRSGLPGPHRPNDDRWFVHRSRAPLSEQSFFEAGASTRMDEFPNECEGICGI